MNVLHIIHRSNIYYMLYSYTDVRITYYIYIYDSMHREEKHFVFLHWKMTFPSIIGKNKGLEFTHSIFHQEKFQGLIPAGQHKRQ